MPPRPLNRVANRLVFLGPITLGVITLACSSAESPDPLTSTGGSPTISGGSGGAPATGGASVATGGIGTGGTTPGTGGNATGGLTSATGGSGAGGAPASGGTNTATGGALTATGGAAAGGTSTGGAAGGGKATSTGGAAGGGKGTSTGGAAAGGAATSTGGKAAGGSGGSVGGSAAGGSSSGDAVKSTGCGKTTTLKGESTHTISVGGTSRSYIVRLPDNYDASHPYRLITSIHPLNGTAAGVASGSNGANYQYYGLWKLAAGSTIFVAPQGLNNSWPSGNVPFIKALITEITNTLCVDTSRVFAEGFSMGGSMSYALACEIPDMIRAVAVHSGGPMSGCNKSNKPVAYFMTHGNKDSVCTYPGYGVPQINEFAALNGCQTLDIPNTLKPTDTSGKTPVCGDFQGCSAGHPTRACIFVGDHTPSPGGEATTWVPAETWKFISQF